MRRLIIATLAAFALLALPLNAQTSDEEEKGPAVLVADSVYITPDRTLVAEGNVEALQGETRLRASRISFDQRAGTLTVEGPIRLDQGGSITILASYAELDRDLQNGLLTGARMVMDQQLQLASLQMTRVGGRYTQLYKTAVTSCHVCDDGRPPLWQIRARKITHDQEEQQLYFEDAQFLILDVPVLYFPGMRLPDPTLNRATGFLVPSVRTTSQLGTGVRVPYFFRLGDHADLTLAPYLSSKTSTLDYRYRQAFRKGRITLEGAHTRDDLVPGEARGYLFGSGYFELTRGYRLDFSLQTASDNAYLVDYGLDDLDRLQSEVSVSRYKHNAAFRTRLIYYDSLRDTDDDSLLPTLVFDSTLERRYFPRAIGGELRLGIDLHQHNRTSNLDILGRDIGRATADLSWLRSWILPGGLRADSELGLAGDVLRIEQDSNFEGNVARAPPRAGFRLSYPLLRTEGSGATQLLEPVVQIGWSEIHGSDVPNDESTFVEFDRGNLLSLSRFPAEDRREDGQVVAYGINWARYGVQGWETSATLGQVWRDTADPDFTQTSGLSGTSSDVLVAAQLRYDRKLALTARMLLDGAFSFSKAELRGDWTGNRAQLSGTYLWLGPDAAESRSQELSEIYLNGGYDISPSWEASANLRYDVSDDRATRAGVGLVYRNECVTVDLSVNRRFTSSTSIEPTTDFGFTIALSGFSVDAGPETYRRSCS